jgi:hypothetical protein
MSDKLPPIQQLGQAARDAFKKDDVSREQSDWLDQQISPAFEYRHKQDISNRQNDEAAARNARTKKSQSEPGFSTLMDYSHQITLSQRINQSAQESEKIYEPRTQEKPMYAIVRFFKSFFSFKWLPSWIRR